MTKTNKVLKLLSNKLKKLSDEQLLDARVRAVDNFANGNNASSYIIKIIDKEISCRGIITYK